MRHIPFVAFPPAEQTALLAVFRHAGRPPAGVCVSRLEWNDGMEHSLTVVTGPGLTRTYPDAADRCWLSALAQDLGASPGFSPPP